MGSPLVRLGRAAYRFVRSWLVDVLADGIWILGKGVKVYIG